MDLDEDFACPLCMDTLDDTDAGLFPCPCGYQICLWCVHHIREQMNGKCPACRADYKEENFRHDPARAEEVKAAKAKAEQARKEAERRAKKEEKDARNPKNKKEAEKKAAQEARERERQKREQVRVVQRNLVCVIGLAPTLAKPEILRKHEYFGQYGKLKKVVVSRPSKVAQGTNKPCYTAYLSYEKSEEAADAIAAVDGFEVEGLKLSATYGTTIATPG